MPGVKAQTAQHEGAIIRTSVKTLAIVVVMWLGLCLCIWGARVVGRLAIRLRARRPKEPGFEYVFDEDGGEVRELSLEEQEYLTRPFLPGDGSAPYVKDLYESFSPAGSRRGFIARRRVPASVVIRKS